RGRPRARRKLRPSLQPRSVRRARPPGSSSPRDEGPREAPRELARKARLVGGRGRGADGLELGLEQMLVDLALVDRDALRDTEPDDRLAVHVELLRELLGRQVIRHRALPPSSDKKAHRRDCVRAGSILAPRLSAGVNGPASRKRPYGPRILAGAGGPQRFRRGSRPRRSATRARSGRRDAPRAPGRRIARSRSAPPQAGGSRAPSRSPSSAPPAPP